LYRIADPNFNGEATVPILWDKFTRSIVNNNPRDISGMLNNKFNEFAVCK